jgi:hypothetical protein
MAAGSAPVSSWRLSERQEIACTTYFQQKSGSESSDRHVFLQIRAMGAEIQHDSLVSAKAKQPLAANWGVKRPNA